MAGQTQVLFTGVRAVIGQIRNGQLIALAVSGRQRVEALPEVPTVNEALNSPELKKQMAAEGAVGNLTTPQAFGEYIAAEIVPWTLVINSWRIKAD